MLSATIITENDISNGFFSKLKRKEDVNKTWNEKSFASVVKNISGDNDVLSVVVHMMHATG